MKHLFNSLWDFNKSIGERGEIGDPGDDAGPDEVKSGEPEQTTEEPATEEIEADTPAPETEADPTASMSPEQARDYWRDKAHKSDQAKARIYSDLKSERTKRQQYQKQYGGLSSVKPPATNLRTDAVTAPKELSDVTNAAEFLELATSKAVEQAHKQWSEQQLDDRVTRTEETARNNHDGSDKFPAYDDIVNTYVVPLIHKNPKVFELIRMMPDPGEASYTLGFMLKYPNFRELIAGHKAEDVMKKINETSKKAAIIQGQKNGHNTSGKLTSARYNAMSIDEFEKEIAAVKNQ